jgi:hypothetical protein
MVTLRYKVFALLSVLLSVFLFGRYYKRSASVTGPLTNVSKRVILPVQDREQVLVNPLSHKITIVTATGTKTETLPDRDSTIDIQKDGMVKVTAKQLGFEHIPFAGMYYSNGVRYGAGLDIGYFKKLDLGVGMAGGSGLNTVVFAQLSYCFYHNVRASITYDHQQHFGVGVSIRI